MIRAMSFYNQFHRIGLRHSFYHINRNLEIDNDPNLIDEDYIVVNDYFGIKDAYINKLACQ